MCTRRHQPIKLKKKEQASIERTCCVYSNANTSLATNSTLLLRIHFFQYLISDLNVGMQPFLILHLTPALFCEICSPKRCRLAWSMASLCLSLLNIVIVLCDLVAFLLTFFYLLVYLVCAYVFVCDSTHQWWLYLQKSKDNLPENAFFFQYVDSRNWTQLTKFGSKHLYLLSHIVDHLITFLYTLSLHFTFIWRPLSPLLCCPFHLFTLSLSMYLLL